MAKKGIVNFYETLEVAEEADEAAIKKTYRHLVLKWHPDKNPKDRDKAEEKIRLINAAYATLSNPTKREKYDLQRFAVDKKHRGVAPSKPKVSPKVAVPKEFMMQPLGHPDKFVRCDGRKTTVPARHDVQVGFEEFFQATKFSLWWLPQVNNMCRVRSLGSKARGDKRGAAAGLAGGLNLSFRVSKDKDLESEVLLVAAGKGQRSQSVDFVAKESTEYEGAFRFETACRRGHYLAFRPPDELRVASLLNEEEGRVLDFMLVDFSATLKYKDLEEALLPVAMSQRGTWLPLAQFRECKEVITYFQKVMQKPVWEAEDFGAYFEGHWTNWQYNAAEQTVRLRPVAERLSKLLRSATSTGEAAIAVLSAKDEELGQVALPAALRAVQLLGAKAADEGEPERRPGGAAEPGREVERRKLLKALPSALGAAAAATEEQAAAVAEIVDAGELLGSLVCEDPTPAILSHRKAAMQSLLQLAAAALERAPSGEGEPPGALAQEMLRLLRLPGVAAHDVQLRKACTSVLAGAPRPLLLQVLQRATVVGCDGVAEATLAIALASINYLAPDEGADMVTALARAGARVERLALALRARATFISAPALALAILALCDKGISCEAVRQVAESLADKAPLPGVEPEQLRALALAAAKIPSIGIALNAVAQAAAAGAKGWAAEELVKLLLAMAKSKEHLRPDIRATLLLEAGAVVAPRLASLAVPDLVKAAVAAGGLGESALLEAAAKEAAIRLPDLSLPHLLLVTQGLAQGLRPDHAVMQQVLEFWPEKLQGGAADSLEAASGAVGLGALTGDQLMKLAVATAPVLRAGTAACGAEGEAAAREAGAAARRRFAEALGARLEARAPELSEEHRAFIKAELEPEAGLAGLARHAKLLAAIEAPPRAVVVGRKRPRSRSGSPEATAGQGVPEQGAGVSAGPGKRKKKKRRR